MELLPGVLNLGEEGKVCHLLKGLYRLLYIRQGEAGIKRWQESLSTSLDSKNLQLTIQYSIEKQKMNILLLQ